MARDPVLTVILTAGNDRGRFQQTLRSILDQDIIEQILIVIYDRAYQPVRDLPEFDHPNVSYQPVERHSTLGQLQQQSVFSGKTEFIAFIEEHVLVPTNWARESLHAHSRGYAGATGVFIPGNPQYYWARIGFLITYGQYIFPRDDGESTNIPADNGSFVRSKLLKFGDDLELLFNTDVLLTRRLVAAGEKLYRIGGLSLAHANERTLRAALTSLFYWNQMYICNLVVTKKWSLPYRTLRLLSMPLVPFVRIVKGCLQARRNGSDMKQFWLDAPSVFLLHVGSALGMAVGLLLGYQCSEWRFTDCETSS